MIQQTMMGMLRHFLFVLLGVLTIVVLVQAQDQSGFISIDCGLPENSSYTEKNTGIYYISDAKFIDSGVSESISPALQGTHQQQLAYVRSFPSGVRNCYSINVTSGTKYLIRGSFYYGNYDDLNQIPEFSLHLGANLWDTVTFPNASLSSIREIIYSPPLDYIHVCLVNTGNGTPFISSIELRTLKNDTYDTNSAESLERFLRLNLGSTTDLEYRYKDDVYDRIWAPFTFQKTRLLSTSLSPKELSQNDYEPPAVVMSTAIAPDNASAPLKFYWDPNNVNDQYYIFMHFNEVEKLASNETRSFNITMNGKFFYGPVVPAYQTTNTIYSISALTGATRYEFSLFQTETSTLPPIINALEIYIVKDFSQSETEQDDVDAITNIKNTYGVARDWQGDPCTPVGYMWEGLNCSFDGNNLPRITSLNLSSNGLTGQIASSISKLTMLQYLDLSNNSLSGPVPDFLTQLQTLKVLNLENNNLTGFVPTGLLDRSNKGSLSLSVGQNPNLCDSASCNQQTDDKKKKKKNNIVIPLVASVAGILVLIVIAAAAIICGLKKRKPRGNGTPFISAIELRTLKNDTYDTNSAESLERFLRLNLGSMTDLEYRYKDDVYDRIWAPFTFQKTTLLSTSLSPKELSQNDFAPPTIVMSTAIAPDNASAPLKFYWDPDNVNDQYYIYMHFNELEKLASNETRAFNITMNGKFFYGPVVPAYQTTNTIYSISALTGATRYEFSLFQTETSTLPPIINALEIYIVKDFSQSETEQDDVDAITNIKNTYGVARDWQGDPCTPVGYMWEGLNCSFDGNNPPRITSLNLSSNGLTGQIASSISKLTMLQYLDLSNNSLSGPVPDFLTQLQILKVLNLENNNLTGFVPTGLLDRSNKGSLSLSVGQNPNLCDSASCNQQTDDKKKKKKNNIVIPVVASVAGILVLIVIAAAAIICGLKKRKPRAAVNIHVEPNTPNGSQLESKKRQYTFNDLVKITNNFERVLGRGGFGTVYHGFIDDTEVAVKILSPSAVRGYQQFVSEVKLLMRVHHRNLTSLIGYCNEETNIGLIYEYMPNGNLYELLSGKNSRPKFLTWEDRLRIAVDSAQGLEYLHNGCTPPIIHRDVKSTNILLNENFHAKLADFGLSKSFPTDGGTHMSTVVAGTPGYLDPEYGISNRLTEKSDVYSFGVVLLEIITSEPAIIKMNENEKTHISLWVSSMVSKGDIKHIVDSRLQEDFDTSSAWKAVETGIACVSTNPAKRPNMSDVVTELKECLATESARKNTGRDIENKDSIDLVTMTTELGPLAR